MQSNRQTLVTPPTAKLQLSKACHAGSAFIVLGFIHLLIYMPQENVQTRYRSNVEGGHDDPFLAADSLTFIGFLFYQLALIMIVFTYLWKSKPCQILTVVFSKAAVVFLFLSIVVFHASYATVLKVVGYDYKVGLSYKVGVLVMSLLYGVVGMIMYWVAICGCCQCTPSTPTQVVYFNGQAFVAAQPAPIHGSGDYNNQSTQGQVHYGYQPQQQQQNVTSQPSHVQTQSAGQCEQPTSYRLYQQEEKEANTLHISASGPPPSQDESPMQPVDHGHHEVCSSY